VEWKFRGKEWSAEIDVDYSKQICTYMSVLRKHFLPSRECLLCLHTLHHTTQRKNVNVINSEENEKEVVL
jgi:hypothetical protein